MWLFCIRGAVFISFCKVGDNFAAEFIKSLPILRVLKLPEKESVLCLIESKMYAEFVMFVFLTYSALLIPIGNIGILIYRMAYLFFVDNSPAAYLFCAGCKPILRKRITYSARGSAGIPGHLLPILCE